MNDRKAILLFDIIIINRLSLRQMRDKIEMIDAGTDEEAGNNRSILILARIL